MRYNEIAPNHKPSVQPNTMQQQNKATQQQRPIYPVQPDQARHVEVQRKLAYDIAQNANNVEPTELDKVKAFARYAQVQKLANANAQQQITTNRQRRT